MSKFLAAIGLGGNKAEADVSYDPALDEDVTGGEKVPWLRPQVAAGPRGLRLRPGRPTTPVRPIDLTVRGLP